MKESRPLFRVIPIAQQQSNNGLALLLTTIDATDRGFSLHMQIIDEQPFAHPPYPRPFPDLLFNANDEIGTNYTCHGSGGSGGLQQWTLRAFFTPALHPAAHELFIRVSGFRRQPDEPPAIALQRQGKPPSHTWNFTIALPGNE